MVILGPGTQEEKEEAIEEARAGLIKEQIQERLATGREAAGERRVMAEVAKRVRQEDVIEAKAKWKRREAIPVVGRTLKAPPRGRSISFKEAGLAIASGLGLPGGQRIQMGKAGVRRISRRTGKRGRPHGSFKYTIPGVGLVPIQAYKKWLSQRKAQIRLQQELKMARLSATPPPDHVRGAQAYPDAEDQFLAAEAVEGMPMEFQPEPSMMQAPRRRFRLPFGMGAQPQQVGGMPMEQAPPMSPRFGASRMSIWGSPMRNDPANNILNAPSIFNNPGQTQVRP